MNDYEDHLKKIEKRLKNLEEGESDSLEMNFKFKLKDDKKSASPSESYVPERKYSKSLECNTCKFYFDVMKNISLEEIKSIETQVLEAALKGSKNVEELKPFYDLEFLHPSANPRRTYEKALLFAQKHTEKGHDVKYHDVNIYNGLYRYAITDYITDRNGNKTVKEL